MSKKTLLAGGVCVLFAAAVIVAVLAAVMGDATAADDKDKDGKVVTTASGLKYVDLKVGEGEAAKEGSRVLVHYTGTLQDGKKFDSSVGGDPFPVTIGKTRVIKGWTEGLQGMKKGGKRKLIIPADLAYGKDGTPDGTIPPNATLIFEVEVVDLK